MKTSATAPSIDAAAANTGTAPVERAPSLAKVPHTPFPPAAVAAGGADYIPAARRRLSNPGDDLNTLTRAALAALTEL